METRAATVDDYDAYALLMPELGVDDPIPSRTRFADELVARTIVAVEDGHVVGYALFDLMRDVGYVRNIVSAPSRRRRGIGLALMMALRKRFSTAGATAWCLNVKPDNATAIAMYERCGLRAAYRSYALRLPSGVVLPPPPPELSFVPVPVEAEELVEQTLRLLPGQLATSRVRRSRQVMQLRRGRDVVGVAVFAPAIPGAFPFRVIDPSLGSALLAHVRALAPEGAPYVQVGIEDDDALLDAVLALGAYLQLEIVHMRGTLDVSH
jgi:GNAT superfamily N-acetyltransferase